ncbi:hypothetical protein FDP41_006230 [Naegleria fowleri]|uniref:EamA domain-containing protein n=1 Tax=Naegleria fowleri TaxID=5763 RepID=A0A6A5BIW6_NAEFO|nr:uncharacterized protein FDP41_006230 [Naegleria fowleri]KAF0974756.1 hypothetical protein FDP41_006230 [Naegleria fowleri]CAG4719029.1 unnamed protein product [Naegleria fowleri]
MHPRVEAIFQGIRGCFTLGGLYTLFLALAMLTTGTINTITTKLQDVSNAKGIGDGPPTAFQHAFFQTAAMFLGELLCLIPHNIQLLYYKIKGKKTAEESSEDSLIEKKPKPFTNPLIFWIPACCDLGGSTLLNFGLFYTDASVYQMLRGILVVFTGLLSVIFLKARLYYHHWAGLFCIVIGCVIVGLSSVLYKSESGTARSPLLGDVLVILAQILAAIQFVVEEKFFSRYEVAPLQAVGWEGYWGLSMTTIVLFVLYWIPGSDYGSVENAVYAFAQCINNWKIAASTLGSVFSIAFFNFFGVSITKRISSTTRSTIDSCRTIFIWAISLIIGWEEFHWLQVGGFAVLLLGTSLYNEIIKIPKYHQWYLKRKELYLEERKRKEEEKRQREEEKKQRRRNIQ